ncbi:MAG: hypothetical protein DMG93_06945 [Acidobacteria bacterium]|nr:MAG: hypothetical protein DMG93_06945 [Acidobacteriota bacterium]
MKKAPVAIARHVNSRILLLRGQKVILDSDLATLYGVEVKHLNQQIKRNRKRFPEDFVFRVSAREAANLRSQIVTSSKEHGGRRYPPYAFTVNSQQSWRNLNRDGKIMMRRLKT